MSDCVHENHLADLDGVLSPQPWMQWRHVASVTALSKTGSYNVSGGGAKDEILHSLQTGWVNNSPIPQWVYGQITRGGARLTLQARSRARLVLRSGFQPYGNDPHPLNDASMLGVGADIGRAGVLGVGTAFAVIEMRQPSGTFPLAPERVGWSLVPPGGSYAAGVELRFISDFWETSNIDGGDSSSESSFETGDTRLDLFAVPYIT